MIKKDMTKKEIKANNRKVRAMNKRNEVKVQNLDPLNSFFGFRGGKNVK